MTAKIGPYDYLKLHIVQRGENQPLELYERRLRRIIIRSTGEPLRVIPEGTDYLSWHRLKDSPSDKVVNAWVLIPVGEPA